MFERAVGLSATASEVEAPGDAAPAEASARIGPFREHALALLVLGIGLLAAFVVWQRLRIQEDETVGKFLAAEAWAARASVEADLTVRGDALRRMARRWEARGGIPEREWRADVDGYRHDLPGILHVDRIDAAGRVRWVEPERTYEVVVGRDLLADPARARVLREAEHRRDVVASGALRLASGRAGFFLAVPTVTDGRVTGYLRVVVDSNALLARVMQPYVAAGHVVVVDDGDTRVFGDISNVAPAIPPVDDVATMYGIRWRVRLIPTHTLIRKLGNGLPTVALASGIAITLLFAFATDRYVVARRRRHVLVAREARLAESERLFRSLLDTMTDGVFVARGGRFVYVNPALPPLLACDAVELDHARHDRCEVVARLLAPAVDGSAGMQPLELLVRRLDGVARWMELTQRPIRFEGVMAVLGQLRDIDDRKSAEARALAEHARYQLVADSVADGVWDVDLVSGELFCSDRMLALTGFARDRLPATRDGWIERVHRDDRAGLEDAFRSHLAQRAPFATDLRFLTVHELPGSVGGGYRWFRVAGRAVWDEAGRPMRMAGSVTDITEQRAAAEALASSEARFRSAMEYSVIGMALVSLNGRWLQVNNALCQIVGYPGAELMHLSFQDITHPDDLAADLGFVEALLAGRIPSYRMEKRYIRSDGTVVWVLLAVALARKADGSADYFISQIEDIDQRKRAEQARDESEARLRAVVETATDAIVTTDGARRIVFANPAVERVFGYAPAELIGGRLLQLFPDYDCDAGEWPDGAARPRPAGKGTGPRELDGRRADGTVIPVELSVARWTVGDAPYLTAVMRDVSLRRTQEARLVRAVHERETLLREVYHRVKNNLQVIQSLLSLQSRVLPEDDAIAREAFTDTIARVRSMALVHEKLYQSADLAAISARDYLGDLVRQIADSAATERRRIRLTAAIDDQVLALDEAIPLGLLLNELINNSLKHAFPGDRSGEIRVSLAREPDGTRLSVADDGVGMTGAPASDPPMASMGTKLADALARQLGGRIEWPPNAAGGTTATAVLVLKGGGVTPPGS